MNDQRLALLITGLSVFLYLIDAQKSITKKAKENQTPFSFVNKVRQA